MKELKKDDTENTKVNQIEDDCDFVPLSVEEYLRSQIPDEDEESEMSELEDGSD